MKIKYKKHGIIIAAVAIIILLYFVFLYVPSGKYDNFAKCLSSENVTMYGAGWCTACMAQKALFGDSFKYVNYVDCPENQQLCNAKNLTAYPTWEINGTMKRGVQQIGTLSALTGCAIG